MLLSSAEYTAVYFAHLVSVTVLTDRTTTSRITGLVHVQNAPFMTDLDSNSRWGQRVVAALICTPSNQMMFSLTSPNFKRWFVTYLQYRMLQIFGKEFKQLDEGLIVGILSELLLVSRTVEPVRSGSRSQIIWWVAQAVQLTILSDFCQHSSITLG